MSFDVHAREMVAIVGGSGSGKSMTALSIMQLLAAETSRVTGSIRLGGRELGSATRRWAGFAETRSR
ncbi:ATP-binding cassette domain-containing protein [Variovorax guangxiensis]|uniref:ATP-binding cassette domain-containing protein n=1 Tax=Variovorax guangxiensis TaxID=1775474 RepID=UPI0019D634F2|nr:ATP-binding cassette domain-containing protein [Variovorax guangxiensis]